METPIRTKTYVPDREVIFRVFYLRSLVVRSAIILVIYLAMAIFFGAAFDIGKGLGMFGLLLVVLIAFIVFRYAFLRRQLDSPAMKIALGVPRYLEFTDRELFGRTEDGAESRVPWDHYSRAVRTIDGTLLYRVGGVVYVPDSAFSGASDLDAFKALLQEKGMFDKKKRGVRR